MAGNRETALKNLQKVKRTRGKSAYTITDLINSIKAVEQGIRNEAKTLLDLAKKNKKYKSKLTPSEEIKLRKQLNFNYLEALIEKSLGDQALAGKILDRLVPIQKDKEQFNPTTNVTVVIEKSPEQGQLMDILKTLDETGAFEAIRHARSSITIN